MNTSRYKNILDRLAEEIRTGKYLPGHKLITHRQLALQEGIALVTASRVYAELEKMGLISSEIGRGTFVKETRVPLGHGIDQTSTLEGMQDLNFNSPLLNKQSKMLRDALRKLSHSGNLESLLDYQPHAGRKHEKEIIKDYLIEKGLSADAEQILIVNGAQHGLAVSVMSLLKAGDIVAVDALTYPGFKVLAEVQGLELIAIPYTKEGTDLKALEQVCHDRHVRAVYCMPTLHNPLGWVMSLEQREKLIAIARKHELIILEDAAYSFLVENPPPAIATLAPDITLYVSGFSKSIATGLRVGLILSPLKWVPLLQRTIRATTWNTAALLTALTCQWIEDGSISMLEREKRQDAMARQKLARKVFYDMDYSSHDNAYFLWLPLPEEVRTDQLIVSLLEQNISISGAEPYVTTGHIPHAIRLALASIPFASLEETLIKVKANIEYRAYGKGP
ncbi:GntR family transcriptional regulator [Marinomonas sp. 42_23_T18]|nr:GntR family transcriptional regulator [Marinomonas sp. 42_23_T18]